MPNVFDQFDAKASDNPFNQFDAPTQATPATPAIARPSSTIRRVVGDTAVDLGKGLLGVGEAAVGLGNLASGGYVGKGLEAIGYDPATSKKMLEEGYTPERVAANKEVADAKGFLPTIAAAIKNPSTIAGAAVESAPLMLGGGAIARGGASLLGKAGSIARPGLMGQLAAIPQTIAGRIGLAAAGEGAVGAGAAAESIRQQTDDGLLGLRETGAALASGAGTAVLGALGGKVAQKLGIADVDVALAGGSTLSAPKKNILRRAAEGMLAEGVFEELPQSAQEQMWQNYATGKPLMDGVAEAAAMGAVTGGVMGGGFNAVSGNPKEPTTDKTASTETPSGVGRPLSGSIDVSNAPSLDDAPTAKPDPTDPINFGNVQGGVTSTEDMAGELDAAMATPPAAAPPSTANLSEPATNRVQQAAANMRMEAQVMDAQAQTGIGKAAAMATAMQADAIEQSNPFGYQPPTFGYEAPTFPPAPNDGRTRLAQQAQAQGIDPRIVLTLDDAEAGELDQYDDKILAAYAKGLWSDLQSGRRTLPGYNPQEDGRGPRQDAARPVQEQSGLAAMRLPGDAVPDASSGGDAAGAVAAEGSGGAASLAGQAPVQGAAAGAQAQGLTPARAPLSVRMGGNEYPVESYEDASAKFRQLRDTVDVGGMPAVELIDQGGNPVGYIGQGGEVYEGSFQEARLNPERKSPVYQPPRGEALPDPNVIEGEASRVTAGQAPQAASSGQPEAAQVAPASLPQSAPSAVGTVESSQPSPQPVATQNAEQVASVPSPQGTPVEGGGQQIQEVIASDPVLASNRDRAVRASTMDEAAFVAAEVADAATKAAQAGAEAKAANELRIDYDARLKTHVAATRKFRLKNASLRKNTPEALVAAESALREEGRNLRRREEMAAFDLQQAKGVTEPSMRAMYGRLRERLAVKPQERVPKKPRSAMTNKELRAAEAEKAKAKEAPATGVDDAAVRAAYNDAMKAKTGQDYDWGKGDFGDMIVGALNRDPEVAERARNILTNGNNETGLKVFFKQAGVKFPKTQREQKAAFDAYIGVSPEKRAASDAAEAKAQADKREQKVASRRARQPVPDFADYPEAVRWLNNRAEAFPSKGAYKATPEFAEWYEKAKPLYAPYKEGFTNKRAEALAAAGIKAGDRVQTSQIGMFMTDHTWTGIVTMRGGEPWVKVDGDGIPASKNGKTKQAKLLRWEARWTKVEQPAPSQQQADRKTTLNKMERTTEGVAGKRVRDSRGEGIVLNANALDDSFNVRWVTGDYAGEEQRVTLGDAADVEVLNPAAKYDPDAMKKLRKQWAKEDAAKAAAATEAEKVRVAGEVRGIEARARIAKPLLDRATSGTPEQQELAQSYLDGDITLTEFKAAMDSKPAAQEAKPAEPQPAPSQQQADSKYAKYDEAAKEYGRSVRDDGAILKGGKESGLFVREKGKRLRIEDKDGNLTYSGAPNGEALGKFMESFWFAEKKPAPTTDRKEAADVMESARKENKETDKEQEAQKAPQKAEPFEHNGTRIYPTKIKFGDEVVARWAVESDDNKAKRIAGERTIGGDSLHQTVEEAKSAADFEAKQAASRKAAAEAESVRAAEAAAKVEANRGKSITERRADAVLDKPTKLPPSAGVGRGSRRETMQRAVEQDRLIVEVAEFDSAAKKRDQDAVDKAARAGYLLGASNPNIPVVAAALEARDRIKANTYEKPSYRLYAGSKQEGSYYELSKVEFDFAQRIKQTAPLESTETLADTDLTPAERASFNRQRAYGFKGSDGVGITDNERSALDVLEREESRANGIEDADKLGLRKAVNAVIGSVFGLPPIQAYYLRGKAGLNGIATPRYMQLLADQQKGRSGKMRTAGLYLRAEDTISGKPIFVLFTDVAREPWMAAFTAAHEVAGHHGLRSLLGPRMRAVLRAAYQNPTVKKVADSMYESREFAERIAKGALTPENARYLAIEEALADLAAAVRTGNFQRIKDKHGVEVPKVMQSRVRSMLDNLIQRIRELFRRKDVRFSDGQVRQLLEASWKAAQGQSASMSIIGPNGALEQVVFHGTPHTVDKFSLQKIGTGEGAQAYGWGMYFASHKGIAESYRKKLTREDDARLAQSAARDEARYWAKQKGSDEAAVKYLDERASDLNVLGDHSAKMFEDAAQWLRDGRPDIDNVAPRGNTYRVDVPEDSDLLDWDKPLSEQPEKVRAALAKFGFEEMGDPTGREMYQGLAFQQGREKGDTGGRVVAQNAAAASEALNAAGVPGLRYLDGTHRTPDRGDKQLVAAMEAHPDDREAALNMAMRGVYNTPKEKAKIRETYAKRMTQLEKRHNYVIWDESAIGTPSSALESVDNDGMADDDYRGEHSAPTKDSGAPGHDVTGGGNFYPDDVYGPNGLRYYGTGEPAMDAEAYGHIQRLKNHPNYQITVYRAVPKSVKGGIKAGDWVTTVRRYALDHGRGALNGDYKIQSKIVRANEIFTNGDSWLEWGYDPQPFDEEAQRQLRERRAAKQSQNEPLESTEDQTQSEAFKNWFGQSVVTENGKAGGKPLVVYKGMWPYDWTQETGPSQGPVIDSIKRTTPFPAFNDGESGIDIGGFFGDAETASRFAESMNGGAVFPVYLSIQNPYVVDAAGAKAGDIQFGKSGKAWRDAMRSGNYDGSVIRNTADEGTIYVTMRAEQVKSALANNGNFNPDSPSILESVEAVGDALAGAMNSVRDVKLPAGYMLADLFGRHEGAALNWWHKSVGTMFNLAKREPLFKRVFDSVQNMVADISHYANAAMDLAPDVLPKFDTIRDAIKKQAMPAKDAKVVSSAVFDGTLKWARDSNGDVVKATELNSGIVWTAEELRSRFNATDAQIEGYRQVRAAIDRSLDDTATTQMIRHAGEDGNPVREQMLAAPTAQAAANILERHLVDQVKLMQDDGRSKGLLETAEQVQQIAKQIDKLKSKGYAPLSRFGRFTVYKDGENPVFLMFETQREANRAARMMKEKGDKGIKQGTMSQEQFKLFKGMTPETLELFGEMLGLDKTGSEQDDLVYQSFLKAAKSNRSALKRLIHRQGIEGYSEDVSRVLASFLYSNARLAATNLHAPETQRAISDIPKEQGDLKDTAIKLNEYIVNPDDAGAFLSSFNFAQYLGGSIASAMVNMTQPLTMSFPWLSQYGGAWNAAKALGEAVKLVGKGGDTGNLLLDEALKRADADGHTQPQEVHQLQALASGKGALRTGDGTKAGDALAKAQNAKARLSVLWGVPFALAEQFNRRSTFIAAWNIAKEQGMADPYGFAVDAVKTTQGIYNKANRPAWSRNAIGGMAFTFKTYSINYVEMLHRMWTQGGKEGKKGVLLAMGVLFLLSGAGGLPGADDLDDLLDGVMQRMGYNFSTKQEREAFFANLFGETGAKFMEHGLSAVPGMPIDVSGRMGMGNLIPSTGLLVRKDDHTRDVAEIAGPTGDFLKRSFESAGELAEGNIGASMLAIAPRAVANAWKGVEMAETGEYRDTRGRKVLETTGLEAASKFIGFQPASVAKVQQSSGKAIELLSNYRLVSADIADRWAKGIHDQDPGEVLLAQKELADWNTKNPDMPIRINRNALRSRVRNLSMDRRERLAKTTPRAVRSQIETMLGNQDRTNTEETE